MLMRPDGQPGPSRYSLGLVSALGIHVVVMAALLSWAGAERPAESVDAGRRTARDTPRLSPAPVRPGLGGGGGGAGNTQLPTADGSAARPVVQAEPPGLQIGIGPVIDHLWQSTVFAIGATLLMLAFRRNRARLRYALWFCASVKFLVPFSLVVWLGSYMVSSPLGFPGTSDAPVTGSRGPALPGDPASNRSMRGLVEDRTAHSLISGFGQSLAPMATALLWPSTFTVDDVTLTWLSLAPLAIWTCGFYAVVASRIRRSRRYWDVVLTSRRVELMDVKAPARLQVALADGRLEPGVIGWMHPVLLLPADIERHLTRPELEAILAHELCHVRRFDNMTAAAHMVVEAIFWFHPLVWWLGKRLLDERERACDEYVLRTLEAPDAYAQGILNICERYVEAPLASISGVRSASLRQRIDAILVNRVGDPAGVGKTLIVGAVLMCVVIVPLAIGAMQVRPTPTGSRPDQSSLGDPDVRGSLRGGPGGGTGASARGPVVH